MLSLAYKLSTKYELEALERKINGDFVIFLVVEHIILIQQYQFWKLYISFILNNEQQKLVQKKITLIVYNNFKIEYLDQILWYLIK